MRNYWELLDLNVDLVVEFLGCCGTGQGICGAPLGIEGVMLPWALRE